MFVRMNVAKVKCKYESKAMVKISKMSNTVERNVNNTLETFPNGNNFFLHICKLLLIFIAVVVVKSNKKKTPTQLSMYVPMDKTNKKFQINKWSKSASHIN